MVYCAASNFLLRRADPIKSILGVAVANAPRVIIRRRFAVGGKAEIIPERAPGR